MAADDELTPAELACIAAASVALTTGGLNFGHPSELLEDLRSIWAGEVHEPRAPVTYKSPPPRPEWLLGMSDDFRKAVATIDRKLQGRLLEAITHILAEPLTSRGDTVKPLKAGMKGMWRYRIGDFRLVYHPDPNSRQVLLVAFTARGDAYA